MLSTLLVPLDGSPMGDAALPLATRLAQAARGKLVLVRAGLAQPVWPLDEAVIALLAETRRAATELTAVAERLRAEGMAVEMRVYGDDAVQAVTETAHDQQADLIVMSMLGMSGMRRSVYGSVAEGVLRHAHAPLLLVPAMCETSWHTSRVLRALLPLDGSATAEAAIGPAVALAETLGGELLLVHLLPAVATATTASAARGYLDRVTTDIKRRAPAVTVSARIAERATIAAVAREYGADVIAMTTRGQGHSPRLAGGTASDTLRRAGVPALLVGPGAVAQGAAPRRTAVLAYG